MHKLLWTIYGLLLLGPLALAFWSGSVQDQIISFDDNLLGWYPRMAVDSHGKIHVVWNETLVNYPSQYEIHYSSSTDNGRTWSAMSGDIMISFDDGIGPNNGSSIAIDSDDNIYVVWSEENEGIDEIHYTISTNGGLTWSGQTADLILSDTGGTAALYPEIIIDQNDVIHVVWIQGWQGGANEVYYSRSTNGGATWSSQTAETIISYPDGQHAIYPDIALGPNNEMLVVWREDDDIASPRDVMNFSLSTDGGNSWSGTTADYPITQSFSIASYPHNVIDPDGNFHVTWWGTQSTSSPYHYELYYSRSIDGGLIWTGNLADQIVSYVDDANVSNPNFGVDHCGNLFAVWNEYYTGTVSEIHISISTDCGYTWSGTLGDEIISFPDGRPAYRPFLVAGNDDTLHATWGEGIINNYYQIHYSRGDAICEQVPEAVDDLTITMDGNNAVLQWSEIPDAVRFNIYRSDDPGFVPTPADSIGYTMSNTYTDPGIIETCHMKYYNVKAIY